MEKRGVFALNVLQLKRAKAAAPQEGCYLESRQEAERQDQFPVRTASRLIESPTHVL